MNRFIIGYWAAGERAGWCWARDASEATAKAKAASDPTLLDDELADRVWAEPWCDWRARDLDIVVRDEHDLGWTTKEAVT